MAIPTPNSSAQGYLPPLDGDNPVNGQVENDDLEDIFQKLVVGISGLRGGVVFPRWQPEPPNYPDFNTDWAAIGITGRTADTFPWEGHYPSKDGDGGYSIIVRHEEISVMVSFYGPRSDGYAARFREGIFIEQNRVILRKNNAELVNVGDFVHTPELIRLRWLKRVDMTVVFRRQVIRKYAVLDLLKAEVGVESSVGYTAIALTPDFDDNAPQTVSSTTTSTSE